MVWTTNYYHFDAVGSTRGVSGSDQSFQAFYPQLAFGEQLVSTSLITNPFRFVGQTGYYFDADIASFNVRQRVYDHLGGHWLSQDPARNEDNLFRYVHNNPLLFADPSGLKTIAQKIHVELLKNVLRGSSTLGIWTRIRRLYIDEIAMIDETGEMKAFFAPNMQRYYRTKLVQLESEGKLTAQWQTFHVPESNVLPGEWQFGLRSPLSTGWWLGGARSVSVDITFDARVRGTQIEVRYLQSRWDWYDAIDAHSVREWWNEKETWWGTIKSIPIGLFVEALYWDIYMDKILDVDYNVDVYWYDNVPIKIYELKGASPID